MQRNIVQQFTPKSSAEWLPHTQLTRSDTHTTYQVTLGKNNYLINLHMYGNVLMCDIIRNMNRNAPLFTDNREADKILKTVLYRLKHHSVPWDHLAFSHSHEESSIFFLHRVMKPLKTKIVNDLLPHEKFNPQILMTNTNAPTIFLSKGIPDIKVDQPTIRRIAKIIRDSKWNDRQHNYSIYELK